MADSTTLRDYTPSRQLAAIDPSIFQSSDQAMMTSAIPFFWCNLPRYKVVTSNKNYI